MALKSQMSPITNTARVCETCGSPIETTSAGDLGCIACLIGIGLDAEAEQSDPTFTSAPDQLGAYTIEHHADGTAWELGHGAMGVTYRAIDKPLDRPVALKIINTDGRSHSAEARERFMREARAAAALRHPNVATVYQFGVREETGQFFYAMELVEGETLEERVRRLGPLDVLTTIDIALQVTAALEAAEERGLVHRDLKPGNLMLVSQDNALVGTDRRAVRRTSQRDVPTIKVIDFGVAKAVTDKTNPMALTHGGFVGTPAFASPEQFTNAPVDVRSDIYSLGVTLWFLLTGHMLFSGRTIEEIQDARRSKSLPIDQLKAARVPQRFVSLLVSMLAIEPAARPAGARELSARLQAIRSSITGRGKAGGRIAIAAAIVGLATIVAVRVFQSSATKATSSSVPEKSVAVLPLENLSDDPNNAYFADGIREEILTRLATIADLKVISRTSTQRYHSKPANLAEIAKQLGVANILEGSVQKTADQVRVNVQLINAQTDSHLWAESYDRKLSDMLGVESEVAKRIAESLQAKLSGREKQALAVKPTNNPEAYDAYLRGLAFETRSVGNIDLQRKACDSYELAVQLDPNFAVAWARLSRANAYTSFSYSDATAGRRDTSKRALENAQRLEPNSPEILVALGYYQYHVLNDYGAAKTTFDRVSKILPGNSEVARALGLIARREGQWDQSVAYWEQALALDPRNVQLLMDAAETYAQLRQFPAALKLYDRVLDITPNDLSVMAVKACIYQAQGDLQEAARFLSGINEQTPSEGTFGIKITQLRLERRLSEAVGLLQARLAKFQYASLYDNGSDQTALAFTQLLAGDAAGAKVRAEQARNTLEQLCRDQPGNAFAAALLSQAYAAMGEKQLALKTAEHAMMLLPTAKDRVAGPVFEENVALIQTIFGEKSQAISTIAQLLQTPCSSSLYQPTPITSSLLRLDPIWDPLRGDPAFQKLCEEKIDKSIAVLPFENLSANSDNAYFADGIQEEVLTRLASIAGLKVISRASTQRYRTKPRNLAEIAKQLGVANIVEGSVQKVADQARVNVQLVNAQTDSHLWADTFDRKLTDIFGVQSEIAKGIAAALQAKLTGSEDQALAVKPTNNPEAYDAYLRGLSFEARALSSPIHGPSLEAIGFYKRAVQLDPNFAAAWARLSRQAAAWCANRQPNYASLCEEAKRAVENAQKLAPNSTDTLLALGYNQFWKLRDYAVGKATFDRLRRMLPGSSEVLQALGDIARREGHWEESIAYYEQALVLDPRNGWLLTDTAWTYTMLRQFPAALKLYDRVLDIAPNDPEAMAAKASIYQAQGNLQESAKWLSGINWQNPPGITLTVKFDQLKLERNYGELLRLAQAQLTQDRSPYDKATIQNWIALVQHLAGDTAGAKVTGEAARNTFEQLQRDQPDDIGRAWYVLFLSEIYAAIGEKQPALEAAERAIKLYAPVKDSVGVPQLKENQALVQAMVGENSSAISTLARLLHTPYKTFVYNLAPVTPALLRLDPFWDPLRSDPAFQKLCEEKQP